MKERKIQPKPERLCYYCIILKPLEDFVMSNKPKNYTGWCNDCFAHIHLSPKIKKALPTKKKTKPPKIKKSEEEIKKQRHDQYKKYYERNKYIFIHNMRKYQCAKKQRTPPWFENDKVKIMYQMCEMLNKRWGTNFQVDHYIPLQGELVSGLHCWDNLQLMDGSLNSLKGNKYVI